MGTSNMQNPIYTYTKGGTYNVTLVVTSGGSTSSKTKVISITAPPPIASFSSIVSLLTVSLIDNSTQLQPGVTFSWAFGDGGTSVLEDPIHTYTRGGTYTVTLKVTNPDGQSSSISKSVIVKAAPPVAGFSFVVSGASVLFTDTSTSLLQPGVSFNWSFGDGSSSTEENPTHVYAASGTYSVTLTVTNPDGQTNSATKSVTVVVPPPITVMKMVVILFPDSTDISGLNIGSNVTISEGTGITIDNGTVSMIGQTKE